MSTHSIIHSLRPYTVKTLLKIVLLTFKLLKTLSNLLKTSQMEFEHVLLKLYIMIYWHFKQPVA